MYTLSTKITENGHLLRAKASYVFPANCIVCKKDSTVKDSVKKKLYLAAFFLTPGFLRAFTMLICIVNLQDTQCNFPKNVFD